MVQFRNVGRKFWDPWDELSQLQQEVNRLFSGSRMGPRNGAGREFPAVCVYTAADDLIITAELPGIDHEQLDITATGDTLTLRGSRGAETLKEGECFHRQERPAGQFVRTLQLPFEVDPEKTEARYEKGVLHVKLVRPEQMKLKKVAVKAL